jgi:hypothetical protein
MNIGLLLLIGNLLFGGVDDDKAESVNPNNIPLTGSYDGQTYIEGYKPQ